MESQVNEYIDNQEPNANYPTVPKQGPCIPGSSSDFQMEERRVEYAEIIEIEGDLVDSNQNKSETRFRTPDRPAASKRRTYNAHAGRPEVSNWTKNGC